MCRLNFSGEDSPFLHFGGMPRPIPCLAWAIPVDVTELGANLEAYSNVEQQIMTLRLCHRFDVKGPLSRLPPELLEQVIDEAQQSERLKTRPIWEQEFMCYQGRCKLFDHFSSCHSLIEGLWDEVFGEPDLGKTTAEVKTQMVMDFVEENPDELPLEDVGILDDLFEVHYNARIDFIDRVCLCEDATSTSSVKDFRRLNQLLKNHFGLEVIILHEILSERMREFLPDTDAMGDEEIYFAACYLTLCPGDTNNGSPALFADKSDRTAFRKVLDPASFGSSERRHFQFSRALRLLDLRPHFHLSALEPLISPSIKDNNLLQVCACKEKSCANHINATLCLYHKGCKLDEYLNEKNKELASQDWPQLTLLAASGAVSPAGWPFDWA